MISGEMLGEANLTRKLLKASSRAEKRVRERARKLGEELADEMRAKVPVDTGGTRDSIRVEDDPDAVGVIVKAGGTPETTKPTADGRHSFDVAVLQNYGTQHIAATYFFTHPVNTNRKRIAKEMSAAAAEGAIEILDD